MTTLIDELRALVAKWRAKASRAGDEMTRTVVRLQANELTALIDRHQAQQAEPDDCTSCGQRINGPAPRGICGDCTAEQAEPEREALCVAFVDKYGRSALSMVERIQSEEPDYRAVFFQPMRDALIRLTAEKGKP